MDTAKTGESIPAVAPKPSAKPKLFKNNKKLLVTPEKPIVRVVNEGDVAMRNKHIRKKVMFQESLVKDLEQEDCG